MYLRRIIISYFLCGYIQYTKTVNSCSVKITVWFIHLMLVIITLIFQMEGSFRAARAIFIIMKVTHEDSVVCRQCTVYESALLTKILSDSFRDLNISENCFYGKRIVIKPNLVMKAPSERAATTHPAVIDALLTLLGTTGAADIVIAESPGGPYTATALRSIYKTCGMEDIAVRHGIRLNFETGFQNIPAPNAVTSKNFDILSPICEADIIINVCKLKSHSLTKMSGAVKNFFGTIPGLKKFEMHARFPDYKDFNSMLVDLCAMLHERMQVINIVDAVIGMEGNGPTGGEPRGIGAVLVSRNAFCADLLCTEILGFGSGVPMVEEAKRRGFCPEKSSLLTVTGDFHKPLYPVAFKTPDAQSSFSVFRWLPDLFGGRVYRWLQPKPEIDRSKCVGCGECVRSCPVHTIDMLMESGKKRAVIRHDKCIRCYCCQELCPFRAVRIKKNPVFRLIP